MEETTETQAPTETTTMTTPIPAADLSTLAPAQPLYFHRDGSRCPHRVRVESAHVASYSHQDRCSRCGGEGGSRAWAHTGYTCFACSGSGKGKIRTVKVYSAEKLAKLNAATEKRDTKKLAARIAEAEIANARKTAARASLLTANPGLETALLADHAISRDLADKLVTYGSLSPAQIVLAFKLAADANAPKPVKLDCPAGRQTIEGTILSVKEAENDFGVTWKMLVEVSIPEGSYRVFGTVPGSICGIGVGSLKGRRVKLTATVQPKEPGFGFYSRPTGAQLVGETEATA